MTASSQHAVGEAAPLAVTMGEPAGIGGEITLKAWRRRGEGVPPFFAIDDPGRLERLSSALGLAVPIQAVEAPEEAPAVFAEALPVIAQPLAEPAVPGRPDPANAGAVRAAIETAVSLVREGRALAVVTNPIHKGCLHAAGFPYPGHTEWLAALAGGQARAVMMLVSPRLRVVPVTVHVSLHDAVASLSASAIIEAATVVDAALRRDFAIAEPRLAIAGLNPHAGEEGMLGREEADIIQPAIDAIRGRGIEASGPASADALFTARARSGYDAAICMYHDQALIPIKALDFDETVNVTLGLPFVRTSPDHGTALDIAGSGTANEASLVAALKLAAAIARKRAAAPSP